jgi:hypothetical protein
VWFVVCGLGANLGGGGLFDIILQRGDSKLFHLLSPRFLVGIFGGMASTFDFCNSKKGGTCWMLVGMVWR